MNAKLIFFLLVLPYVTSTSHDGDDGHQNEIKRVVKSMEENNEARNDHVEAVRKLVTNLKQSNCNGANALKRQFEIVVLGIGDISLEPETAVALLKRSRNAATQRKLRKTYKELGRQLNRKTKAAMKLTKTWTLIAKVFEKSPKCKPKIIEGLTQVMKEHNAANQDSAGSLRDEVAGGLGGVTALVKNLLIVIGGPKKDGRNSNSHAAAPAAQ